MEIQKKFFPSILLDNEQNYFAQIEGVISSVDELCNVLITKKADCYDFRIATSLPMYNNMLIEELIKYHNLLNIRLELSKSIKSTGTVQFKVNL